MNANGRVYLLSRSEESWRIPWSRGAGMPNDGVGFFLSAGPLLGWARHGLSRPSFDYILDLLEPVLFGYTLTTFKL